MVIEVFNSAVVLIDPAAPLGADYASPVMHFRDCNAGCIHVVWKDVSGSITGKFVVHGGLSRVPADMDDNDVEFSDYPAATDGGTHLWEYTRLVWCFGQLRWIANGTTAGTARILARGIKY